MVKTKPDIVPILISVFKHADSGLELLILMPDICFFCRNSTLQVPSVQAVTGPHFLRYPKSLVSKYLHFNQKDRNTSDRNTSF